METRRRNYAINPRSPSKRKRRTRINKKQVQQEIKSFFPDLSTLPPLPPSPPPQDSPHISTELSSHNQTSEDLPPLSPIRVLPTETPQPTLQTLSTSPTLSTFPSEVPHPSTFPTVSELPPLPSPSTDELHELEPRHSQLPSPIAAENIHIESTAVVSSLHFTTPAETALSPIPSIASAEIVSPTSPDSVSDLASVISRLDLRTSTISPNEPLRSNNSPSLTFDLFTTNKKLVFNPNPVIFPQRIFPPSQMTPTDPPSSTMSPADENRASQAIDRAYKRLPTALNFTHLAKDGSNFVLWKRNTARAMKGLLNIIDFWDNPLRVETLIEQDRDGLASAVILNTIHEDLKDLTDSAKTSYDSMKALQRHFQRGGRTNQFSLFTRLINLRLDIDEEGMLAHISQIDSIVSELESTGFTWTSDSIRGLLYQLHMPADMTKEINKELDGKFDEAHPNFKLDDIKSAIQIHLAREKTASETITINALSTNFEAMAMNRTPQARRNFNQNLTTSMNRTPFSNRNQSFTPSRNNAVKKIDPMRWRRGPAAITDNEHERTNTENRPISIPGSAVKAVKDGVRQCFFCGKFGHSYLDPTNPCVPYNGNSDRTGPHWRDWRRVAVDSQTRQWYSIDALYPQSYARGAPQSSQGRQPVNASSVEVHTEPTHQIDASALDWSSEGFGLVEDGNEVPSEYSTEYLLFDGGATDA